MKKLSLILLMVFAVSWVMAQNTAVTMQNGGDAAVLFAKQTGTANNLLIDQFINNPTGTNTAGVSTSNPFEQFGNSNLAKIKQVVSTPSAATKSNFADIFQNGNNNAIVGATGAVQIDLTANAEQITEYYSNSLNVTQNGNANKVGLYQTSKFENFMGITSGDIEQQGNVNELVVVQIGTFGGDRVSASSLQEGDYNGARVKQEGGDHMELSVVQRQGNNKLAGANSDGSINLTTYANQYSADIYTGDNTLTVDQSGGSNQAGLTQLAGKNNLANIIQEDGNNKLGVYQNSVGGNNTLDVLQTNGGNGAQIVQNSAGNNNAWLQQW